MMPVPLPWLLLALLVAVIGAGGVGYWQGGKHKANEIAAQEQRDQEKRQEVLDAVADAVSKIEIRNVTIRQKAETITREVPVYRDCRHDPDGLRLINEALTGVAVAPGGELSSPATPPG